MYCDSLLVLDSHEIAYLLSSFIEFSSWRAWPALLCFGTIALGISAQMQIMVHLRKKFMFLGNVCDENRKCNMPDSVLVLIEWK